MKAGAMKVLGGAAVVCLVFAGLASASAQQRGDPVAGKVVSASDGRPLPHATVTLVTEIMRRVVSSVSSGDDGTFRFDSVAAGRYDLSAQAPGYLRAAYLEHGQFSSAIVTGAGLDTGALVLNLTPAASISGHVVDESGDPVQQGRVTLYRATPNGENPVTRMRTATVEDDGSYEFDRLAPGRYFVTASAKPWYAMHPLPEPEGARFAYRSSIDPALDVAYPVVFYPNAQSSDGATPIDLEGGEQFTADMQMTPQPALTITVKQPGSATPAFGGVMVMQSVFGSEDPIPVEMRMMNGQETVAGLAPGQYRLQQFGAGFGRTTSSQTVDLSSGSTSVNAIDPASLGTLNVTLMAAPGATVPEHVQVMLRSAGHQVAFQLSNKGKVEFTGVAAGDYRLAAFASGPPMNIAAVTVDGHAVAGRRVHVSAGDNLAVGVTFGGKPVKIEGLARHDGKAVAGSMVVLVPAEADPDPQMFRRDESDLDGGFTLNDVMPGKYILVAIDDGWGLRWNDAATLLPYLRHGTAVAVPASGSADIHLREPVVTQPR